ncbi:Hypothetical predicted protein [Xyrichtys novacula]|uniref:Uncharacterized protein n=1 Tax=Xyrichtys novacula TaxID=13765 RepID=A0AAV1FCI7_XYRNO|nr:Hypothetical predicted protein [Xyrichtys novacula]
MSKTIRGIPNCGAPAGCSTVVIVPQKERSASGEHQGKKITIFSSKEARKQRFFTGSGKDQLLPGQTSPCQLVGDKQVLKVPAGAAAASSVQAPQLVSISVQTSSERRHRPGKWPNIVRITPRDTHDDA